MACMTEKVANKNVQMVGGEGGGWQGRKAL